MLLRSVNTDNAVSTYDKLGEPPFSKFKDFRDKIACIAGHQTMPIAEQEAALKAISYEMNKLDRSLYKKLTDFLFDTLKSKAIHKSVKIPSGIYGKLLGLYNIQKLDNPTLTFQGFLAQRLENQRNVTEQHTVNSGHTPSMVADTELPKLDVQPMAISLKTATCCTTNSKHAQETTPAKGTVPDIEIILPTRLLAKPIALKKLKQQAQRERSVTALQERKASWLRKLQKSQLPIPSVHKSSSQMELYVTENGDHFELTDRLKHYVDVLLKDSLTSKQKSKLQSGEFKLARWMVDLLIKEAHEMVLEFH